MAEKFFNLLTPVKKPKTYWDKIYDWVLNQAKLVIFIVEILIVIAFVLRVVIDNTAKERRENFDEIAIQIQNLEDNYEQEIRQTQRKESEYTKIWQRSFNYSEALSEIVNYVGVPQDEFAVRMAGGNIIILGYQDLDSLRNLEEEMKSSTRFGQTATVDALSLEQNDITENSGQFALTAEINEEFLRRESF